MNFNVSDLDCPAKNHQMISDGHFGGSNDFHLILMSIKHWDEMCISQANLVTINRCKCIENS